MPDPESFSGEYELTQGECNTLRTWIRRWRVHGTERIENVFHKLRIQ